ncbi:hypothetical protein [Leeuwenhoekiella sp. H156]|uniref:hypothetical protein n=1 Tax=Leeuwenhoekiella sp. H156 TaxID=3450128 RepID=UPI003FA44DD5
MNTEAKKYDLSFCILSFFDKYVISEVKEGSYVTRELFMEALVLIEEHYGSNQKFVYISNRKTDYNVNPIDYLNCISNDNMVAVALVTETEAKLKTAQFEKNFMTKNVQIFATLKEAIDWAEKTVA